MSNETIGKLIVTFISLISIIGMSSTLYSLLREKDTIPLVRKKPAAYYPEKNNETHSVVIDLK